eukprot:TRINITY_DN5258_c0_g1_i4.p1 TRINITY_DN5258_c0_g1~~TRINITY_DN5258_c0_g1_i4.p1  ORF type:complete len:116 (-),score=8.42 TRINITY_DN5258_c0_g1_i4:70-417(-)
MTVSCIAIAKSIVRGEFVTTNNPLAILLANMPIYTYLYTRLPSHSKLPISPFTITILGIINYSLQLIYMFVYKNRSVSYTHLRAHETPEHLVCRLLLEKKKKKQEKSVKRKPSSI